MDANIKRQVLRTFTYGLYAVSCADEGEVNAFTVNWLRSGSRALAGKLGKSALRDPGKMAGIEYEPGANGCPILHDALAWIACEVRHTAPAGDSTLIVAEVVDTGLLAEGPALTMAEAGFRHAG